MTKNSFHTNHNMIKNVVVRIVSSSCSTCYLIRSEDYILFIFLIEMHYMPKLIQNKWNQLNPTISICRNIPINYIFIYKSLPYLLTCETYFLSYLPPYQTFAGTTTNYFGNKFSFLKSFHLHTYRTHIYTIKMI